MPRGAVDTHIHVLGPESRYPWIAGRNYTPPDASLKQYLAMCAQTSLARVVLVQPTIYGNDNRAILDATRALGLDRARAVVSLGPDATEEELIAMHAAGVRGARVTLKDRSAAGLEAARRALSALARRVAPLGWHIQILSSIAIVGALAAHFRSLAVPVVVDHMGRPSSDLGLDQPGFPQLLELLRDGLCWVKVSGFYRVSTHPRQFGDAVPFARALASANLDRIVWGTDWPHIDWPDAGHHGAAPSPGKGPSQAFFRDLDIGYLLDLLRAALPDEDAVTKVLVDNPCRLYGFDDGKSGA